MHNLPAKIISPHPLSILTVDSFAVADDTINQNLKQSYFWLGILKAKVQNFQNKELMLMPIVVMESVKSSNIESINSTVLDQLQIELKGRETITPEQRLTQNYKEALLGGFEYLQTGGGFDLGLILLIQKTLLPDQNGIRDKEPMVIANTITGKVLWTPPTGRQQLIDYLSNWLDFANNYPEIDPLIKVGILHSQFEAIHPFVDGNGRTGRILIVLYLVHCGLLEYPCLFISDYILKTRTYYYIHLQVSQTLSEHEGIVGYIIQAILQKSQYSCNIIDQIQKLKVYFDSEISIRFQSIYSPKLIDFLFYNPFYTIATICYELGITRNTATKYLKILLDAGLIIVKTGRKNKLYYNPRFLKVLS